MLKKLLPLLFCLPLFANAQDKSNLPIRIHLTGGYADNVSSSGTIRINSIATQTSNWNIGLSAGIASGAKWEVGLGIEYQKENTTSLAKLFEGVSTSSMEYAFLFAERTETASSLWMGHIYTTYYCHLFNRLYFTPSIQLGYGMAEIKTEAEVVNAAHSYAGNTNLTSLQDVPLTTFSRVNSSNSYDAFAALLSPGLTYFFGKHIAATLNLGGVQYSTLDFKWKNGTWIASLSPNYWQYGMIVAF